MLLWATSCDLPNGLATVQQFPSAFLQAPLARTLSSVSPPRGFPLELGEDAPRVHEAAEKYQLPEI